MLYRLCNASDLHTTWIEPSAAGKIYGFGMLIPNSRFDQFLPNWGNVA